MSSLPARSVIVFASFTHRKIELPHAHICISSIQAQSKTQKIESKTRIVTGCRNLVTEIDEILMKTSQVIEPEILHYLLRIRLAMEQVLETDRKVDFELNDLARALFTTALYTNQIRRWLRTKSDRTYTADQLKDEMRISQPEKAIRQKK